MEDRVTERARKRKREREREKIVRTKHGLILS